MGQPVEGALARAYACEYNTCQPCSDDNYKKTVTHMKGIKGACSDPQTHPPNFLKHYGEFSTKSWVMFGRFYVWSYMHKKFRRNWWKKKHVLYRKHGCHLFIKQITQICHFFHLGCYIGLKSDHIRLAL